MEIINNIQSSRLEFEKLNIYKFLKNNSIDLRFLIGNYGFIKIPKDIYKK